MFKEESEFIKKSFAFSTENLLSIIMLLVDGLIWSLKILREKSSSLFIKFGGLAASETFNKFSHC